MFVPWSGLEPDGASPEVPPGSSRVGSSLQGHEGICLRNDSPGFPVTVPVPLSKGNSLHLERLFRLRNCSQDPETGSRGPRSCDGNGGAIGTHFPWQQSRKHCQINSQRKKKALYLRTNGLGKQLRLENWPRQSLLMGGWCYHCLVSTSAANQNWGSRERWGRKCEM